MKQLLKARYRAADRQMREMERVLGPGAAAGKPLLQPFPTEVLMQSRTELSSSASGSSALSAHRHPDGVFPKLLRKHSVPQKKKSSETSVKV